ncbi:glycosyltransferase [Algoriphagus sp. NBT04N3]|jgi:glycosyltransferase involved in cell wall biosynthesis|uniref:glycosyltransferase family 4 protein n=1 Tax=Algoriphagus sp. NBT04N3 TaxID=2705473 RepID=UPI001C630A17|nr:glycosyltransferase [Algoriphagus sp. NBT04N3]QYH38987.1 glycosyltransferase [Algoriphagus sp. NBT04N3]
MRVLWFTNTASLYDQGKHHYNGGGWIESLEKLIINRNEIELAIAFFHPNDNQKVFKNGVLYYPILRKIKKNNIFKIIFNNWMGSLFDDNKIERYLTIIQDFKPDIIQVFGTERSFSLIQEHTNLPVIIHLQGLLNPILNTYFPVECSKIDFVFSPNYLIKNLLGTAPAFGFRTLRKQAYREKLILKNAFIVLGRTEWDKQIVRLFNPHVKYYHIDEVLRQDFYEIHPNKKLIDPEKKIIILSTLSPTIYKGIDIVFKTAKKINELTDIDFEWRIIGIESSSEIVKFFERKESINHQDVNVLFKGKMNSMEVKEEMYLSDIFVHPSYIDNSPNSVCEAQMVGMPVIACDVGGVNSLISHKKTGILVPSNGIYEIVHYIQLLKNDLKLRFQISEYGKSEAMKRHDREDIVNNLINVYKEVGK